jgi:hypothetical protein
MPSESTSPAEAEPPEEDSLAHPPSADEQTSPAEPPTSAEYLALAQQPAAEPASADSLALASVLLDPSQLTEIRSAAQHQQAAPAPVPTTVPRPVVDANDEPQVEVAGVAVPAVTDRASIRVQIVQVLQQVTSTILPSTGGPPILIGGLLAVMLTLGLWFRRLGRPR